MPMTWNRCLAKEARLEEGVEVQELLSPGREVGMQATALEGE